MVGFGSLWTFSSGLYCFFFTLHSSVPEISLYIKSASLLPPTYKFCTYYGTKSVLSACRFFVIFTRICNFCNVFRRFLAVISFHKAMQFRCMEWFSSIRKAQRFAGSGKRNKNSAKYSFLFLSTPAMVSHIKKCYTNYDIIVHRAARLPHGTQTAVRTALPKRRRLFYGKKCDRRSIRRPHLSHQFQPGRRL